MSISTEEIAKYYLEKASIAPALPGCLPYKLTGTELDTNKNCVHRPRVGEGQTGQLTHDKNREAKALHRPRVGGGQTGQLTHDKNREAKALLRPWSVWASIHLQPLPNSPHIIRPNRPNIKAIHPKPQSPVSRGQLIHVRQNNLDSRLIIPNPQGEMNMVRQYR